MPDVLKNAVILNVDDEVTGRRVVTRLLQRAGCTVLEAETGPEALEIAERQVPDLVLLDVQLPGMSGHEVLRRLKSDPTTAEAPVLYLSATATDDAAVSRGLEEGADGYLTKPVTSEVLLSTVRALVRARRALQDARRRAAEAEKAREALWESGALLRFVVQSSPDYTFLQDRDLRYVWVGRPAPPFTREDYLGHTDFDLAPPEDAERLAEIKRQVIREGRPETVELPLTLKEEPHTFEAMYIPWRDEAGNVVGLAGYVRDITERKQADEERARLLIEAEQGRRALEALMEHVPAGITLADADLNIVMMSQHGRQLIRAARPGMNLQEVMRDWQVYEADGVTPMRLETLPMTRAIRRGEVIRNQELVQVSDDGGRQWLLSSAGPIRDSAGRVTGGVVAWTDVTDLREAEEALRRQADLLDLSTEAIFAWEIDGGIVSWNRGAERLYGYTAEEAVGRVSHELLKTIHPQGRATLLAALAGEKLWTGEVIHTTKDGRTLTVETRHQVIESEPGRRLVLEMNRDITERKHADEERTRLLADVERQRSFLAAFLDNAPVPMAYLDPDLRFLRVNRMYGEWLELPADRLIGRTHAEVWGAQERTEMIREVLGSGEPARRPEMPMTYPERMHRQPGYVDFAVFPVKDRRGQVMGLVLSDQEVTERVRRRRQVLEAERARARLAENLNREIAHRTKNNLAMAAGLLQLQIHQQHDPEVVAALSEAMVRLTAFASIQEAMQVSNEGLVDMLPVLRRVGSAAAGAFPGGRAVVSVTGDGLEVSSRLATHLAIITNELITNAVKHGATGEESELRIDVTLTRVDDAARLQVWNSGNPVPEDFDPAEQRGLGLQIVTALVVSDHGGDFRLKPSRNGTLAEAILPLGQAQE